MAEPGQVIDHLVDLGFVIGHDRAAGEAGDFRPEDDVLVPFHAEVGAEGEGQVDREAGDQEPLLAGRVFDRPDEVVEAVVPMEVVGIEEASLLPADGVFDAQAVAAQLGEDEADMAGLGLALDEEAAAGFGQEVALGHQVVQGAPDRRLGNGELFDQLPFRVETLAVFESVQDSLAQNLPHLGMKRLLKLICRQSKIRIIRG